jgi:hypothetical protein
MIGNVVCSSYPVSSEVSKKNTLICWYTEINFFCKIFWLPK